MTTWALWIGPYLGMWQQALDVFRHAGGVVGCGAAYALHHVHTVSRLLTDSTVVLRAAEVGSLLGHLGQLQGLCTPEPISKYPQCDGQGVSSRVCAAHLNHPMSVLSATTQM